MKLVVGTHQTPTKIRLTLEEVNPRHQECYDDLMALLRIKELEASVLLALPVQGGVQ